MFERSSGSDISAQNHAQRAGPDRRSERIMFRRRSFRIFWLIYIIIGLVVAWDRNYITLRLIKGLVSALLAVLLWWLPLLGVNLHIH
jgi:hypothetical protein